MSNFENKVYRPGDAFIPQAHEFQAMREKNRDRKSPNDETRDPKERYRSGNIINNLSYDLKRGDPVLLSDFHGNAGTGYRMDGYFDVAEPAGDPQALIQDDTKLAICVEDIPANSSGKVAIEGVVWANLKGTTGDRVTIISSDDTDYKHKLKRTNFGGPKFLGSADTNGGLIQLTGSKDQTQAFVKFTLNAALSGAGTTVPATVVSDSSGEKNPGDTINVKSIVDYNADAGQPGLGIRKADGTYDILEMGGASGSGAGVVIVRGLLDQRPSTTGRKQFYGAHFEEAIAYVQSGSLTAILGELETPFSQCLNPLQLNGVLGDRFTAVKAGSDWILTGVFPAKALAFVKLTQDHSNNQLYNKALTCEAQDWRGPGSGPTTVIDRYGLAWNAKVNQLAVVEFASENSAWCIIACQHNATDFVGKTYADLGASGFSITPEFGFDGPVVTTSQVTVKNPAGWTYPGANKYAWCKLNPSTNEWYLYQLECPDA